MLAVLLLAAALAQAPDPIAADERRNLDQMQAHIEDLSRTTADFRWIAECVRHRSRVRRMLNRIRIARRCH